MRTTRAVAALEAASQNAAGPLHSLQQCVHWLRQIEQTPTAELGPEWSQRGGNILKCIRSHALAAVEHLDQTGKTVQQRPAAELQLLAVTRQMCVAVRKLLLYLAAQEHPAVLSTTTTSSSSSRSGGGSSGTAGTLVVVAELLTQLLKAMSMCASPLAACIELGNSYAESGTFQLVHHMTAQQLSPRPC
jgi:hypothetical protein